MNKNTAKDFIRCAGLQKKKQLLKSYGIILPQIYMAYGHFCKQIRGEIYANKHVHCLNIIIFLMRDTYCDDFHLII